ncbi:hypothetical protein [Enterovibrio paralichthyis]|uniref:hypothetical protein n=1 Tax=Enterovibrio paralichthyis TaxID=2853805 RepID=UPI001C43FFA3|nr:hypothetical protein [Enterovibrio paralichthyis]MBV7300755.1 hypothetical protein [Enterovibrio paralichthyis]
MKNPKRFGIPCFKYLVNLPEYRSGNYTTQKLASDLIAVATEHGWTDKTQIETSIIYRWIQGFTVPKWAQQAALELAVSRGWQIVDDDDVWCAVWILRDECKLLDDNCVTATLTRHGLKVPATLGAVLDNVIDAINL